MKYLIFTCLTYFLTGVACAQTPFPVSEEIEGITEMLKAVFKITDDMSNPVWWKQATVEDVTKEIKNTKDINRIDSFGDTPLATAILSNAGADVIKILLNNGADPNYKNKNNVSIIDLSIGRGDPEILRLLISKGAFVPADIFSKNAHGIKNEEIFKILIKCGADINATDEHGNTPLMSIAHYAGVPVMEMWIKYGANTRISNKYGDSFLSAAVINDNPEATKLALKTGAGIYINTQAEFTGETVLMNASFRGKQETVKLLIEHGANVNLKNHLGKTALMGAIPYPEIVRMLLKHGADVNLTDRYGETALSLALKQRDKADGERKKAYDKTAALLKRHGTDINTKDKNGKTALHLSFTKPEILQRLIDMGADVNATDNNGNTPVMSSVYPVQCKSIEILLKSGANPNVKNNKGQTALMIQNSNPEAVGLLLKYGADVNAVNAHGYTALDIAVIRGSTETVKVLLKHGADMKTANKHGYTPLMYAALNNREEILDILLKNGGMKMINAKNDKGQTALNLAKTREVTDLLLRYGAK